MLTKVFKSGNSQAVRIPKELWLETGEIEIFRRGNEIILRPTQQISAVSVFDALTRFVAPIERIYETEDEKTVFLEAH